MPRNIPFKFWRKECHGNGCIENVEKFQWGIDGNFYKDKENKKLKKYTRFPVDKWDYIHI